jgi:hypothetical protein
MIALDTLNVIIMLTTVSNKRDKPLPLKSLDLSLATFWTEEGSDIVMFPEVEPLSISWSSLKHKQVIGSECILQITSLTQYKC